MNRVIFNYYGMQNCCDSKFHGASEYGKTVLKYLAEKYSDSAVIAIIYNPICPLEGWLEEILVENGVMKLEIKSWNDINGIVEKFHPNIFYSPTRLPSDIRRQVGENVLLKETVHDFRRIELIEDIKMARYMPLPAKIKNFLKWVAKKYYRNYLIVATQKDVAVMDSVYFVSMHTYYSMKILFDDLCVRKISVFYSPAKYVPIIENQTSPIKGEKYILTLGGDRWTKNPFRTVLAMDLVLAKKEYNDYKAVVIGNISNQLKRRIKNINNFIFFDYVDTEMLERFYLNCDIFVYASLNEGFGYPPIEAMKYGKTCIVSGTSSMPEICGGATYYVNPYDIYEIAEKIMTALNEKIDKAVIYQQVNYIKQRQLTDLKDMCEDIMNF